MQRLPFRPNLDHLRQQAKDLLAELRHESPQLTQLRLAAAQRLLARRYGFSSWAALRGRAERLREIEHHVRRFEKVHARNFPAIRPLVSMDLITDGALGHPSPVVRRLCIQLLDHVIDERGIPVLVKALNDPVPRVRRHALHALTCDRCKPHAIDADVLTPVLERARRDPNDKVRFYAVAALQARASEPGVRQALARLAAEERSPNVRRAAELLIKGGRPNLWSRIRP